MLFLIDLFSLILLSLVVYQDFKQREISWILLPLLFISFALKAFFVVQMKEIVFAILFNIGFIVFQLFFLTLWVSFKNKRWVNIINVQLGLGDILFFIAITSAFATIQFIVFYVVSITVTLAGFIIYKLRLKNVNPEIPLAGAMSAILIFFIVLSIILPQFNFYGDLLFLSLK